MHNLLVLVIRFDLSAIARPPERTGNVSGVLSLKPVLLMILLLLPLSHLQLPPLQQPPTTMFHLVLQSFVSSSLTKIHATVLVTLIGELFRIKVVAGK